MVKRTSCGPSGRRKLSFENFAFSSLDWTGAPSPNLIQGRVPWIPSEWSAIHWVMASTTASSLGSGIPLAGSGGH